MNSPVSIDLLRTRDYLSPCSPADSCLVDSYFNIIASHEGRDAAMDPRLHSSITWDSFVIRRT